MKNLKYYPFERNRYFYGKLLTADDFQAEQQYMNNKRRMGNRFLHGCGVVCGLNVEKADGESVALESGVALDFAGREIVVDQPVKKRLASIEGYDEEKAAAGLLYLCIEYTEENRNPVRDASGTGTEYGKIGETFRLYLTDREPEGCVPGNGLCYEEKKTVFWQDGVRVSQILPRYVRRGDELTLTVDVENISQKQPIRFTYELELEGLSCGNKTVLEVSFDENLYERKRHYEIPYTLTAKGSQDRRGRVRLRPGSIKTGWRSASSGSRTEGSEDNCPAAAGMDVPMAGRNIGTVDIVDGDIGRTLRADFHNGAMEDMIRDTYRQSIYLAAIRLTRSGTAAVIEEVEQVPFGQYVDSGMMFSLMNRVLDWRVDRLEQQVKPLIQEKKEEASCPEEDGRQAQPPKAASGTVVFDLESGCVAGRRFFSDEIVHGLGPGKVRVMLGEEYESEGDDYILYGAGDIFDDESGPLRARLAARVDIARGTLVIGVKLREPVFGGQLRVHWLALQDENEDENAQEEEPRLFLRPDTAYLNPGESCYFEPVTYGMSDSRVRFAAKGGGTADAAGRYTAPEIPGVYEVEAESAAYPGLKASAFVVVREPEDR